MTSHATEFHRADPAVLDEDPFWAVVRRRHPDLDIVVLPDEPAVPVLGPDDAIVVARAAAAELVAAWQLLLPTMGAAAAAGAGVGPSVRWGAGDGGFSVVLDSSVTGLGQEGGVVLLRALLGVLGREGWGLRPTTRGDLPTLRARHGQVDMEATAGPGATVITLATSVLPLASADLDGVLAPVLAEVREEVASWQ